MSVDTLRRAAALMRERDGEQIFHLAVADWLDAMADDWRLGPLPMNLALNGFAVARTYLGESA